MTTIWKISLARAWFRLGIVVFLGTLAPAAPADTKPESGDWTPAWAKKAVWYQILPDRFRNGDPKNDPRLADLKGAYPHDMASAWQIHPWTSDWYMLQPWEKANNRGLWDNIQRRRYGGDLQGILDKLDYLQGLGVTALYLNPIFQSPSLHKYDSMSYHHVDPTLGPDRDGDLALIAAETPGDPATWKWTAADRLFLKLVQEVHKRGMRIILDGVFNHMGIQSWPFQDVVRRGKESPCADWFTITDWTRPGPLGIPFQYKGWFGVPELPELRQDENGLTAGPRGYVFAATRRWLAPDGIAADGIDGWRLDVAFCIRHPFWKAWRTLVKSINPRAYLTAELVDPPEVVATYLQGDEFDAAMNYNFTFACWQFFTENPRRLSAAAFAARLQRLRGAWPACADAVMQNLAGSHDTQRFASHLVNGTSIFFENWGDNFGLTKADSKKGYDVGKPSAAQREIQKLMTVFQMTWTGAPMVYYGDEAGLWGANDPCCRKPMVWPEGKHEPEKALPDGRERSQPDVVRFDGVLFAHFRDLIALRKAHPALLGGSVTTLQAAEDGVFAFSRSLADQRIIVIFNIDPEVRALPLEVGAGKYRQLWPEKDQPVHKAVNGKLDLTLGPRSAQVWEEVESRVKTVY